MIPEISLTMISSTLSLDLRISSILFSPGETDSLLYVTLVVCKHLKELVAGCFNT